jgi:tRNA 5-methylaminomethyl-2-thiouridine biosynthesis bifunctional protein
VTPAHPQTLDPALIDWTSGAPVSLASGDLYFSRQGGARETRSVFMAGNDLPDRFRHSSRFRIGELGFGTGLNFLATRRAFLATAAPGARLEFVSFECAPLSGTDLERVAECLRAEAEGQLAEDLCGLRTRLPAPFRGWHRLRLDEGRVTLSLYLGDAREGLDDWRAQGVPGAVDAWYLDGFAPRLAPDLWSDGIMGRLAALSAPGATVATFSVARSVREALEGAGFVLQRVPGSGGKREVLRGRLGASLGRPATPAPRQVAVIGGGLAGAAAADALVRRGIDVTLLDRGRPASGASGNPWAVLHPRLPLDAGPRGPFLLDAYRFAVAWLDALGPAAGWHPQPVLQFTEARRPERLARVAERFAAGQAWIHPDRHAGEDVLALPHAGRADLPRLIRALLAHPGIGCRSGSAVHRVTEVDGGWRIDLAEDRGAAIEVDAVVLAAGVDAAMLMPFDPALGRMRGQITRVRTDTPPTPDLPILTGRGHAVPLADGWVCGSSYLRDGAPCGASDAERQENLARLDRWLALLGDASVRGRVVEDFVGVRCTAPDRFPLIGELVPGLWVSTAHASSGLTTCPLAGEWIAAGLCGEAPVADAALRSAATPCRLAPPV